MLHEIKIEIPKAVLCGVSSSLKEKEAKEQSLEELERLADTAGIETLGRFIQNRQKPDKTFYLGKGFLAEVVGQMQSLGADVLIFDNELSPSQARNIEKTFDVRVIDRTEVILDIFINMLHRKKQNYRLDWQSLIINYLV